MSDEIRIEDTEKVLNAFDELLKACGQPTLTQIMDDALKGPFGSIPEDQRPAVMQAMNSQLTQGITAMFGMSIDALRNAMTDPEKVAKAKAVMEGKWEVKDTVVTSEDGWQKKEEAEHDVKGTGADTSSDGQT